VGLTGGLQVLERREESLGPTSSQTFDHAILAVVIPVPYRK